MSFFKWLSNKLNLPRARIGLGTQKNEYALGEEVKGDFQIVSEEEFEVERIAVNLSCWENLKKRVQFPLRSATLKSIDKSNTGIKRNCIQTSLLSAMRREYLRVLVPSTHSL